MAKSRKADVFAGKGSLADRLRKRRMAIEDGDPSGGNEMPEQAKTDKRVENAPASVIRKGYFTVDEDE